MPSKVKHTAALLVLLTAIVAAGCSRKSPLELRQNLLFRFITPPEEVQPLDRKAVRSVIYDIKAKGKTRGRAVHLGSGLFLTAWHVVDDGEPDIQVIQQVRRNRPQSHAHPFLVLHFNVESDLALLQADGFEAAEEPVLFLKPSKPEPGAAVTKFIGLIGSADEDYQMTWNGRDYTTKKEPMREWGVIRFDSSTMLYELEGLVLDITPELVDAIFSDYKFNEYRSFSSILTYNGDSGSGVFEKTAKNGWRLGGIITHSYEDGFEFDTPGHPLGYKGMQQTAGVFSHSEAITHFIREYLLLSAR